jgi:hypothetical protein
MSKQIEEMRSDLIEIFDEEYERRRLITPQNTAEKLSAKGYRKQEWVSVDESLPENKGDYMVFTKNGNIKVMPFFTERNASAAVYNRGFCEWTKGARTNDDDWWKPVGYVTHWMPLPEPPKMKGGE